jgi:regulatory protein
MAVYYFMGQVISALKVQKRNPNRVNVYLDGKFSFGLARVVAAWLKVGQTLESEKIKSLQEKDTYEVALQKALHYLQYRPRSEAEVRKKLIDNGYDPNLVEETLKRLIDNNLMGDEQFSRTWVENRATFRPRSKRMLANELKHKGVSDEVIQAVLSETANDETQAYQLVLKRKRSWESLDNKEFIKKSLAYLGRKGFDYETSRSVTQRILEEVKNSKDFDTNSIGSEELEYEN